MSDFGMSPLVWAKDKDGDRYLCPLDAISDANKVSESEKKDCIDDDSRLDTRKFVPSNTPEGKRIFTKSFSLN